MCKVWLSESLRNICSMTGLYDQHCYECILGEHPDSMKNRLVFYDFVLCRRDCLGTFSLKLTERSFAEKLYLTTDPDPYPSDSLEIRNGREENGTSNWKACFHFRNITSPDGVFTWIEFPHTSPAMLQSLLG